MAYSFNEFQRQWQSKISPLAPNDKLGTTLADTLQFIQNSDLELFSNDIATKKPAFLLDNNSPVQKSVANRLLSRSSGNNLEEIEVHSEENAHFSGININSDEIKLVSLLQLVNAHHQTGDKQQALKTFRSLNELMSSQHVDLELRCRLLKQFIPFLQIYGQVQSNEIEDGAINKIKFHLGLVDKNKKILKFLNNFVQQLVKNITDPEADHQALADKVLDHKSRLVYIHTLRRLIPFYHQYFDNNAQQEQPERLLDEDQDTQRIKSVKDIIASLMKVSSDALSSDNSSMSLAHSIALIKLLPYCSSQYSTHDNKTQILNTLSSFYKLNSNLSKSKKIQHCKNHILQERKQLNDKLNCLEKYCESFEAAIKVDTPKIDFNEENAKNKIIDCLEENILQSLSLSKTALKAYPAKTFIEAIYAYIDIAAALTHKQSKDFMLAEVNDRTLLAHKVIHKILNAKNLNQIDQNVQIVLYHLFHYGHLTNLSLDWINKLDLPLKTYVDEFIEQQLVNLELSAHQQLAFFYQSVENTKKRYFHEFTLEKKLKLTSFQKLLLGIRDAMSHLPLFSFFIDDSTKKIAEKLSTQKLIQVNSAVDYQSRELSELIIAVKKKYDGFLDVEDKQAALTILLHLYNHQHLDFIDVNTISSNELKDLVNCYKAPLQKQTVIEALWQKYLITSNRQARHFMEVKLVELLGLPESTTHWFNRLRSLLPIRFLLLTKYFPFPLTEAIASYFDSPKQIIKKTIQNQGIDVIDLSDNYWLGIPGTAWLTAIYNTLKQGGRWLINKLGIGLADYKDQKETVKETKQKLLQEYQQCIDDCTAGEITSVKQLLFYLNKNNHLENIELEDSSNKYYILDENGSKTGPFNITKNTTQIIQQFKNDFSSYNTLYNNAKFTLEVVCQEYALFPRLQNYFKNKQFDEKFYNILTHLLKFGGVKYLEELRDKFFAKEPSDIEKDNKNYLDSFINYVIDEVVLNAQDTDFKKLGLELPPSQLQVTLNEIKKEINRYGETARTQSALRKTPEEKKLYLSCDHLIRQLPYGPERAQLEKTLDQDIELDQDQNDLIEINTLLTNIRQALTKLNIPYVDKIESEEKISIYRRTYKNCQHLMQYFRGYVRPNEEPRQTLEEKLKYNVSLKVKKNDIEKLRYLHNKALNTFAKMGQPYFNNEFTFEKTQRALVDYNKQDYRNRKGFWQKFSYFVAFILALGQASMSFYGIFFGMAVILGPFTLPAAILGFLACLYTNYFLFKSPTNSTLKQLLVKKDWFNGFTSKEGKLFAIFGLGGFATGMALVISILVVLSVLATPAFPPSILLPAACLLGVTTFIGFTSLMYVNLSSLAKMVCNWLVQLFPEIEAQGWGFKGLVSGIRLGLARIHSTILTPGAYSKQGGYINASLEFFSRIARHWKNPLGINNPAAFKPIVIRNLTENYALKLRLGTLSEDQWTAAANAICQSRIKTLNSTNIADAFADMESIKQLLQNKSFNLFSEQELNDAINVLAMQTFKNNEEKLLEEEFHKQIIAKRVDMVTRGIMRPLFILGAIAIVVFATLSTVKAWHSEMLAFLIDNPLYNLSVNMANTVCIISVFCISGFVEGTFNLRNLTIYFERIADAVTDYAFKPLAVVVGSIFSKDCREALDKMSEDLHRWLDQKAARTKMVYNNFLKDPKRGILYFLNEAKKTFWDTTMVFLNAIGTASLIFKNYALTATPSGEVVTKPFSEIPLQAYIDTGAATGASAACNSNELDDLAKQAPLSFIPTKEKRQENQFALEQETRSLREEIFKKKETVQEHTVHLSSSSEIHSSPISQLSPTGSRLNRTQRQSPPTVVTSTHSIDAKDKTLTT